MTQVEGGFTGGGPIVPRKLFLSGGFDRLRTKSHADPQMFALPTVSFIQALTSSSYAGALFREFPLPDAPNASGDAALVQIAPRADFSRADIYARIDYQPSAADRIFVRFLRDGLDQPQFLFSPYPGFSTPYLQASLSAAGNWKRQIGASLLNELRGARSGDSVRFIAPNSSVPQLALFRQHRHQPQRADLSCDSAGPAKHVQLSQSRRVAGSGGHRSTGVQGHHLWKVGGSFFQRSIDLNLGFGPGGYLVFTGFDDSGRPAFRTELQVEVDRYASGFAPVQPDRQYRYRQAYAFAQDSFRLTNRLTLDFGLRYEWYGSPFNTGAVKDTLIELARGPNIEAAPDRGQEGCCYSGIHSG